MKKQEIKTKARGKIMSCSIHEMAYAIKALLEIYCDKKTPKVVKDEIKKSIHTLLSPDKWGGKNAVSEKAQAFADERKFKTPLSEMSWRQLGHNKLKDKEKKDVNGTRGLILEHIIPRHYIFDFLVASDRTIAEIEKIIDITKCAVIDWKEDVKLNELGFAEERPDPKEAYGKAEIKLKDIKDMNDFINLSFFQSKLRIYDDGYLRSKN